MRSLPAGLPWKILAKVCRIFDESIESEQTRDILNLFIEAIRTRNTGLYIALCKGQASLKQLNKLEGCSIRDVRMIRLLTCFVKYQGFILDPDLEQAAFNKFQIAEKRCKEFNDSGFFSGVWNPAHAILDSPIKYMKEFISAVCGRFSPSLFTGYFNGPGASIGCRGLSACEAIKTLPPYSVNQSCAGFAQRFFITSKRLHIISLAERFASGSYPTNIFHYNEYADLQFVPKDATSLRTITIGNTVNVSFQLALSEHLRNRLRKVFGVNLKTQEYNQLLALYGSLDGSFATIDLESASDTLALGLLNLFPTKWAEAIFRIREHRWSHPKFGSQYFHKISAMGNGLTFTLQSIIYSSVVYAAFRMNNFPWNADILAIHGDDIVIPDFIFFDVCYLLKSIGMKINTEKTFYRGRIRESCGKDYFSGKRIDRFTVKNEIKIVTDIIKVRNSFKAWADLYDIDLSPVLSFLESYLEKKEAFRGPNLPDVTYEWLRTDIPSIKPFYHKEYQRFFYRVKTYKIIRPTSAPIRKITSNLYTPLVGDITFACGTFSVFGSKNSDISHFISEMKLFESFNSHLPKTLGNSADKIDELLISSDIVADCLRLKEAVIVKRTSTLLPLEQWG